MGPLVLPIPQSDHPFHYCRHIWSTNVLLSATISSGIIVTRASVHPCSPSHCSRLPLTDAHPNSFEEQTRKSQSKEHHGGIISDTTVGQTGGSAFHLQPDRRALRSRRQRRIRRHGRRPSMKRGDVAIQRGTMHQWINHSKTEWTRMLFVLQESKPLKVAGQSFGEELAGMAGVRSSD